jgi:hypothetical protein
MAISNITTPRTMSIDAMRPVLEGASPFLSFILTTRAGIFDPVAVVVSDMRFLRGGWNSALPQKLPGAKHYIADAFSMLLSSPTKQKYSL